MNTPFRTTMTALCALACCLSVPASPLAQSQAGGAVPRVISFTGELPSARGLTRVTAALFRSQTDELPLWSETQEVVVDEAGRYTMALGSTRPEGAPLELFASGEARWLALLVDGREVVARVLLVSVPYAAKAADAETLGGRPLSAFVLAGDRTGTGEDGLTYVNTALLNRSLSGVGAGGASSGTPGYLGLFTNTTDLGNSVVYQTAGRVGVGTTTPEVAFHSVATATPGALFDVFSDSLGALPVVFRAARGTPGAPAAVQTNDILGGLAVRGYTGKAFTGGRGQVMFKAAENWTDVANGTYLSIATVPIGGVGPAAERIRVAPNGSVGIGTTTPGQLLSVAGTIESTSGGFKYPDGTTQSTAPAPQIAELQAEVATLRQQLDQAAPSGSVIWARGFGGVQTESGRAVAWDSQGNIIMVGTFTGSIDLGGGNLVNVSAGTEDIFVAKFDQNGAHIWSQRFGGASPDGPYAVAVDSSDNVIVAGSIRTAVDFGGGDVGGAGTNDAFVVKLTSAGAHVWSRAFGAAGDDCAYGVVVDGADNVLVTGGFSEAVSFGGAALTSAGSLDVFLVKLNSGGSHQWSKRFGSTTFDVGFGIARDSNNNVVVTGRFNGTVNFGGGNLVSAGGGGDAFLADYTSGGIHLWSKRFGGAALDSGDAVAVDADDNVLLAGRFGSTIDFGGGAITGGAGANAFLAKFNLSGTHAWSRGFASDGDDYVGALAVDPDQNAILIGYFSASLDLGGGPLTPHGSTDVFVTSYAPDGWHRWSENFGGTGSDTGYGIAADATGRVVITGAQRPPSDFGRERVTGNYSQNAFLARVRR